MAGELKKHSKSRDAAAQPQPLQSGSNSSALSLATDDPDPIFDEYVCPIGMSATSTATVKQCLVAISPKLYSGVSWGPLIATAWGGDFGYWIDRVKKCPQGLSRGFIRGKRMTCTFQLDYTQLPLTRRMIPEWSYHVSTD